MYKTKLLASSVTRHVTELDRHKHHIVVSRTAHKESPRAVRSMRMRAVSSRSSVRRGRDGTSGGAIVTEAAINPASHNVTEVALPA